MRILLLLVIVLDVSGQCTDNAYCNDNIDCTLDSCFNGFCNYIPQNDTCYDPYCIPGHCKVMPYMIDSCGCFTVMLSSLIIADSMTWTIGNTAFTSYNDTFCFPPLPGIHRVVIEVYYNGEILERRRNFYFGNCSTCLTRSDCNDQNLCTWDECWQGECRHQKACVRCSAWERELFARNCCCD